MASRKAYRRRRSSAWILAERQAAHSWSNSLGWPVEAQGQLSPAVGITVDIKETRLEIFCFYGEIGLIARRHPNDTRPPQWFLADGTSVDPGLGPSSDSCAIPPRPTTLTAVADMSSKIPSPFIRIDVSESPDAFTLSGFSPKPAEASNFNSQTDRRLGQLMVDAAGRLHDDLLAGKQFPDFGEITRTCGSPQTAHLPSGKATTTAASGQNKKNYAKWKLPHIVWSSISDFAEAPVIADGVHSIQLDTAVCVDVYIRGNPFSGNDGGAVLTFLAGAVTDREKKTGPFFTGLGVAADLDIPLVSVADPTLDTHEGLGLAWFTGRQNEGVDDGIARILASLADRAQSELLLVGGSGGGFASLKYGARLGSRCSVFVWNAQTDLLKYSPRFVRNYLSVGLGYSSASLKGPDWIEASRQRMEPELQTTVLEPGSGLSPRRLLYLQNADDWHVDVHFAPWAKANGFGALGSGTYAADADHVGLLAMAAPGHQPPPVSLISRVITKLRSPEMTAQEVADDLLTQEPICSQNPSLIPSLPLD